MARRRKPITARRTIWRPRSPKAPKLEARADVPMLPAEHSMLKEAARAVGVPMSELARGLIVTGCRDVLRRYRVRPTARAGAATWTAPPAEQVDT